MALFLNRGSRALQPVNVKQINSNELIEFHLPEGYDLRPRPIGSGTYGVVARTTGTTINQSGSRIAIEIAVKKFRANMDYFDIHGHYGLTTRFATLIYRELKLLQHLNHANISRILDLYTPSSCAAQLNQMLAHTLPITVMQYYWKTIFQYLAYSMPYIILVCCLAKNAAKYQCSTYLVTEYVGSTLDKHLKDQIETSQVRLPFSIIPNIIRDTLRALKYLESANVLHRDLSPSNLAINTSGKTVLIDFGLARTAKTESERPSPYTANVCTFPYAAPEVNFWREGEYDREADIWSVGCILAELLTWETLFKDERSKIIRSIELFGPIPSKFFEKARDESFIVYVTGKNLVTAMLSTTEYFATNCKVPDLTINRLNVVIDFLKECLQFHPDSRITIENALRHPFLREIYVPEDHSRVRPLVYDDSARSIEQWKETLFNEIQNFPARVDPPRP